MLLLVLRTMFCAKKKKALKCRSNSRTSWNDRGESESVRHPVNSSGTVNLRKRSRDHIHRAIEGNFKILPRLGSGDVTREKKTTSAFNPSSPGRACFLRRRGLVLANKLTYRKPILFCSLVLFY